MELGELQCVDAGSEYCPCYLSEENSCIICTQLQDKGYCHCNWMGVCIYNNFHFLGNKRSDLRRPEELTIVNSRLIGKILVLTIRVTRHMARSLNQPGAYIFLRNKNDKYFFDAPMSVMTCEPDKSLIKIAIEVRGVKTKKILQHGETISVRGPYWNGIFGLDLLKKSKNLKCLVLARSIAQAPAILPIKHLLKNKNQLDIILNKRSNEYNFIKEYLNIEATIEVDMVSDQVAILCKQLMKKNNYDLVFIGGSDRLQNKVKKAVREIDNNVKFVTTNNNLICCGEGVCGSCSIRTNSGIWIKTCKVQNLDQ